MARNPAGVAIEAVPAVFVGSAGLCVMTAIVNGTAWPLFLALFVLYLAPPLLHRVHDAFAPLEEGSFSVVGDTYLPWWGSHQLQVMYLYFPALESGLRIVPGLYSAWLRLWGSQVGRHVTWTPQVTIGDRSLMVIGDHVVFGFGCEMSSHVISWRDGELKLLIAKVVIEDGALIGARAGLGPGCRISKGATVPAQGRVEIHEVFE